MTSGISPQDLRQLVIRPTLIYLGLDGTAAEELMLGTAAQESRCGANLAQIGGPALGVWQIEPATHDDIWANFLTFRPQLANKISTLLFTGLPKQVQLVGNLYYACSMARVQYFRSATPLPAAGDLEGQAAFYKLAYNTPAGARSVEQYMRNAQGVLNV